MKVLQAKILASKNGISQEQWLEYRRMGIGGSDAAAIVGLSKYSSAFSVYLDKIGLLPEQEDNEAMRQGRDLEEYVARRFIEHMQNEGTSKKVKNCNFILQHQQYEYLLANVDRLIVGENAGLECKTTSVYNNTDFQGGDIPLSYYVQCQHYMAVTGADKWYLAILVLNKGFYVFCIPRKEEEIQSLIVAECDFWQNNVLARCEPNPDGSEKATEVIKKLYSNTEDITVDLMAFEKEINVIAQNSIKIKELEKDTEKAKQLIQVFMKEANSGYTNNHKVTWRGQERSGIDSKRLKEEYPNIYEQLSKTTAYRVFSIKEIKGE